MNRASERLPLTGTLRGRQAQQSDAEKQTETLFQGLLAQSRWAELVEAFSVAMNQSFGG